MSLDNTEQLQQVLLHGEGAYQDSSKKLRLPALLTPPYSTTSCREDMRGEPERPWQNRQSCWGGALVCMCVCVSISTCANHRPSMMSMQMRWFQDFLAQELMEHFSVFCRPRFLEGLQEAGTRQERSCSGIQGCWACIAVPFFSSLNLSLDVCPSICLSIDCDICMCTHIYIYICCKVKKWSKIWGF